MTFDDYSKHAIGRIERLGPSELAPGTLVIPRLRAPVQGGVVAEPLSLVRAGAKDNGVDALHFDDAPQQGMASGLLERLKRLVPPRDSTMQEAAHLSAAPIALRELRHELQRQAERGSAPENAERALAELMQHADRLVDAGLTAFRAALARRDRTGERLLRAN